MSGVPITVLIEGGHQLHEFRSFGLRVVHGFDPGALGARCLLGRFLRFAGEKVPLMNTPTASVVPSSAVIYLHARHAGGAHVHAALAPEPGSQVELRLTSATAESRADLARLERLLLAAEFRFAKTMPTNPHWYTLRKHWARDADFVFAVEAIRRYGYRRKFHGVWYTQLDLAGGTFWSMGWPVNRDNGDWCTILINRKEQPVPTAPPSDQTLRIDHVRPLAIPDADAFTGVASEFTQCACWRFGASTFGVERPTDLRPRLRRRRRTT